VVFVLNLALLLPGRVGAAEDVDPELVKRIAEAVVEQLRSSGALREEIRATMQAMIEERQQAQQRARLEQQRRAEVQATRVRPPDPERDSILGKADAVVSLIEYSDFECPYCKRFHPVVKAFVEKHGDSVNWVYRHFPLPFHNPGAQQQAEAAECAKQLGGNEKFWLYTDALYERTQSGGSGFPKEKLEPLAKELGLDPDAFRTCLESGTQRAKVLADYEEGQSAGITGTPGNILRNNKTGAVALVSGAASLERLEQALNRLLVQQN
jgi:protein-disulfide isomerase